MTDPLVLTERSLHVWQLTVNVEAARLNELEGLLSAHERSKVSKFAFEHDQKRYVVAKGGLRALLSRYLEVDPRSIVFDVAQRGKPFLSDRHKAIVPIEFNVSHSGDYVVCAFSLEQPIGVDIEYAGRHTDYKAIARRYFAPCEQEVILKSPSPLDKECFYNAWVRKEAYLKAVGHGLMSALDSIEVTCHPNEPAQLIRVPELYSETADWNIHPFTPASEYFGAVVTPIKNSEIFFFNQ